MALQSSAFYSDTENALRIRDDRGQTTAEYAVILTVITATVVAAVALLSTNIAAHVTDIANLFK